MKTVLFLISFFCYLFSFSQIPTQGLVFWMPFNNSIKDESIKKTSTSYLDVTFDNDRYGKTNSAGYFNGSSYAYAIDSGHLNLINDKTISAWIYIPSTVSQSNYSTILAKHLSGNYYPTYAFQLNQSVDYGNRRFKIDCHFGKNSTNYTLETTQLYTNFKNEWINIIYTFSSSTGWAKTYWNGVISDSIKHGNISSTSNSDYLYIGRNIFGNTTYFTGYIDDIAIYDRVLTPNEINQLYKPNTLATLTLNPIIKSINIYPNPVNDKLNISCSNSSIQEINIQDALGRVLFISNPNERTTTIDVSEFNKGIYYISIQQFGQIETIKFIK